ncbi:MAG: heparinase II/III family protein [Acidobacteriia bacterium]|nr:heparinase II/III family protein [Terriglobia bacterium]
MDRREFVDRSRQELARRADATLSHLNYDFTRNLLSSSTARPRAFFFKPEQVPVLLDLIWERLPKQAERVLSRAQKICSHRFDLLGYADLDYGDLINWHLDVVHAKQAPLKAFYRVKYLDFAEVGDSKITWELNRHQHLVTLAKAYRLTGDDRYSAEIRSQWQGWHAANPYPWGINWASSLEVGLRSLSWHWMYFLLEGTPAWHPEFHQEWLRAQALNGRHLQRYLSTYFSPNTHLLGEAVALFFLGTLCGELPDAESWKRQGWQIILEEARRQVNPDGLHFEQSTYYHVYALDLFLHAALLASASGQPIPAELEHTLERMLNALFILSVSGPPPRFGDDDGGRVFDPGRNRPEHLLDPLVTGAILFGRADFKRVAGDLSEETIWLLGKAGVDEWDRIQAESVATRSAAFEDAGIYVLAGSSAQLAIKGGPAVPQSHGHEHADALSLCLQSAGRQLLIDPGTCEYVGEGSERNRFRGTAMHNTLRVDGQDQMEPAGPFSWKRHVRVCTEQWICGESFDLFVGSHDGYERLQRPAVHRRWVLGMRSGVFLVRDLVEGAGKHCLEVSWHLSQDLQLQQEHLFRFKNSSQGFALLPLDGHGWSEEFHKDPWSPVYGQQGTTTVLNFGAVVSLPSEFVTLLVPLAETSSAPGRFTVLQSRAAASLARAYRYQTKGCDYRFFFGRANQAWNADPVSSDAELVGLTTRTGAAESDVFLCNGTYVEINGARVLSAKRSVRRCELLAGRVSCSDAEAIPSFPPRT